MLFLPLEEKEGRGGKGKEGQGGGEQVRSQQVRVLAHALTCSLRTDITEMLQGLMSCPSSPGRYPVSWADLNPLYSPCVDPEMRTGHLWKPGHIWACRRRSSRAT